MDKPVLAPAFTRLLAAHNPVGMKCSEQDVLDWFDMVWPVYAQRSYRNHRRAIASWWTRVTERDILRARERGARIRDEKQLDAIESALEKSKPKAPEKDFFAELAQ